PLRLFVHKEQIIADRLERKALIDIIDARQNDDVARPRLNRLLEAGADLAGGLAGHAVIKDLPLRPALHHPISKLTLRIALAVRRNLERRLKGRSAGR